MVFHSFYTTIFCGTPSMKIFPRLLPTHLKPSLELRFRLATALPGAYLACDTSYSYYLFFVIFFLISFSPHVKFTFAKIWIMYAQFEVRQKNLKVARLTLVSLVYMYLFLI